MTFRVLQFVILLIFCFPIYGQQVDNFKYNKNDILLYNIGIGAVFGSVGALVNKKESEEWHKVLLKGFGQGALGGYIVYESKNLLQHINKQQDLTYALYAKGVNSIGVSMIENASMNRDFWEVWHINFGFNRFEVHTKENFKFQYKFMPLSFLINSYLLTQHDFRLRETFQTGEFVFRGNTLNGNTFFRDASGFVIGNSIVYDESFQNTDSYYTLLNHELVHVYQNYDFNPMNSIFSKSLSSFKFLQKHKDFLYLDFHTLFYWGTYEFEKARTNLHHNNFFEFEAYYFSNDLNQFR